MGRTVRYVGVSEQAGAAAKRLADARALLSKGAAHTGGAMYLAGYALECRIKAKAMERHRCATLPELRTKLRLADDRIFSHKLEQLIVDLLHTRTLERLVAARASSRPAWLLANTWSPQWRYDNVNKDEKKAREFVDGVEVVYKWLGNNV
jgi:hypothetical protein